MGAFTDSTELFISVENFKQWNEVDQKFEIFVSAIDNRGQGGGGMVQFDASEAAEVINNRIRSQVIATFNSQYGLSLGPQSAKIVFGGAT